MLFIRSQKGFSLIEAVVGMVLLAILVGAILSVTLGDKTSARKNLTFNASCKAEAQRLISEFKSKGLVRDHYSFPSRTAVPTAGPGGALTINSTVSVPNEPSAREVGVNDGGNFVDRWLDTGAPDRINTPFTTGNPNPLAAPTLTLLRPYTLIMGTISTLETIHNNFSAVCTAGSPPGMQASSAPAPLSTIFANPVGVEDAAASNTGLFDPDAYLYIRMFDTATGAPFPVDPCGGTHDHVAMPNSSATGMLNIFPPGLNSGVNFPAGAPVTAMQIGQIPPSVRFNAGYEVTITVQYDGKDGTRPSCSVTEKFQYPLNMADPARPLVLQDAEPTISAASLADAEEINTFIRSTSANDYTGNNLPPQNCNAAPSALNFRVGNVRPGSVFMCRNLTQLRPLSGTGVSILGGPQRLDVTAANGRRQTFYSSELSLVATSRDNGPGVADDANLNAEGFYQFNSLHYPFGTYFCDATEGCNNLPRFSENPLNTNPVITFGNYEVRRPFNHDSDTATAWDNTFKTGRWVPCEYAQISCATNAYSASGAGNETLYDPITQFVKGSGTVADGYHIQYGLPPDVLPPGCEVHMQVAEVDSAYNVRTMEFYEYTHEVIPGDRLVHNAGDPPSHWRFVCSLTNPGSVPALQCPIDATGRTATTAQTFLLGSTCYINYPGSPTNTNDYRNGVWRSNPADSEAGPPPP